MNRRNRCGIWSVRALALVAVAACGSNNVIGPANQLQVTNAADDFQFQVTAMRNVSQTLSYSWSNTGDSANINQASSLTGGTATLTLRGPGNTVLYQGNLATNGTMHSQKGVTGTWRIDVVLSRADGAEFQDPEGAVSA